MSGITTGGIPATSDVDAALGELAEDLARRLRAGDPVDLEAFLGDHPHQAEGLRRLLPSIRLMAELGRSEAGRLEGELVGDIGAEHRLLGDFEILREVGRGGMGVVYEARQISLGRRVALKVLPFAGAMDPRKLQRFQIEAQAAACLHHTNIVPVFAIGCERGVHYYAMQFLDGQTLAALIDELRHTDKERQGRPTNPAATPSGGSRDHHRLVARLGIQAAEALDHAHRLGIVHRDIKPSNLILDGRGNLWITDFGLARIGDDSGLTMTGDVMGTLRYMSPEQALGRRAVVDPRSDVYSLGVTLYELLTLRPPLEGVDRQELLRRIAETEPDAPRQVDSSIPRELETIVLKAMDKEPGSRYATAQDLADDLGRFLEHKPIHARRPSLVDRAAKWTRRHATLVGSLLAGLALAAAGLAIGLWLAISAWRGEAHLRERAEALRRQAKVSYFWVLNGITEPLKRLGNPDLEKQPEIAEMRQRVLSEAAAAYEAVIQANGDLDATDEVLGALIHLGLIHTIGGDHPRAQDSFLRAIALSESSLATDPEQTLWDSLGMARFHMGIELWEQGAVAEAASHLRRSEAAFRRCLQVKPGFLPALQHYAWLLLFSPDVKLRDSGRSVDLARKVVELATPQGGDRVSFSAGVRPLFTLGFALYRSGDTLGAREALGHSMDLRNGGDAYEWFVMVMVNAREGRRDEAQRFLERAEHWTRWNRHCDIELHFLETEASSLLREASLRVHGGPHAEKIKDTDRTTP